MNIGTLKVIMAVSVKGLEQAEVAMKKFKQASDKMTAGWNDNLRNAGMQLRSFGWLATTTLTMPLVMFGKATMEAYKTFEFNMQKIVSLAGIAEDAIGGWGEAVLEMAPKVGKSATEVSDALYYVASSGFKSSQALLITELSAKAAASGLGETKTVANFVTSAMNAYRESNLTASKAIDTLLVGVREGKVEAEGFASAIQQVIPIAAEMSVKLEEVVGFMAAMSLTGSSASNTAVYLKQILASLKGPTIEAENALRTMGTSSQELRDMLDQPGGLFTALTKIKNLTEKYGETMLDKVFPNVRAMIGFLSVMGENLEYNSELLKRVANSSGALGEIWSNMSRTTKVRLDQAIASLNVGFIKLGKTIAEVVVPAIEGLIQRFNNFIKWINQLNEGSKKFVVWLGIITAALGPLALLASMVTYLFRGLLKVWEALVWVGTKLVWVFKLLAKGNVWAWIATAIAVAGSALFAFRKKSDESSEALTKLQKILINVNGEIKKLNELTKIDFESMSEEALLKLSEQAWKGFREAEKMMEDIRGYAGGITKEEVAAGTARFGKYKDVYDQWQKAALMYKDTILETEAALAMLMNRQSQANQKAKLGQKAEGISIFTEVERRFKDLQNLADVTGVLGYKINVTQDQISVLEQGLKDLIELGFGPADKEIQLIVGWLKKLTDTTRISKLILDQYNASLQTQDDKLDSDKIERRIERMKKEATDYTNFFRKMMFISNSWQYSVEAGTQLEFNYQKGLVPFKEYLLQKKELDIKNAQENADEKLRIEIEYQKTIRNYNRQSVAQWAQYAADGLAAVASFVEASKQRELSAVGDNAKKREEIEKKYFLRQKRLAIAQAIMNGAVAITQLAAQVGGPLDPLFWVGAGLIAASTAAQVALISAQKMAEGGIVPAGYPRDTYPALLSSGERVIPPDKLDSTSILGGKVVFRIEGNDLVGILDKENTRNSLY